MALLRTLSSAQRYVVWVLVLLLVANIIRKSQPRLVQNSKGESNMIAYLPNARSEILSATHILLVRISQAQADEWSPREGFGIKRKVQLTLELQEVLKGEVAEPRAANFRIVVTQAATGTPFGAKMPGVWSGKSIEPGNQYVAFGQASEEHSAAALLNDPKCRSLIPSASALFDVRLARETPAEESIDGVLTHFRASAAQVGFLYPDYLLELRGREITSSPSAFGVLAGVLEDSALSGPARTALIENVYNQMNLQTQAPPQVKDRFILALFRLLRLPQFSAFHENIVTSYLPVFLTQSSPNSVFSNYPGEREQARQAVAAHPGSEVILRWLDQK
jgi:hypothetical protein